MCNKRITFFKSNTKNTLSRLTCLISCLLVVVLAGCNSNTTKTDEVLRTEYPELAEFVVERDFTALNAFTDHKNPNVASMAWRASAKSSPQNLDEFVNYAIAEDSYGAWYALSLQSLNDEYVSRVAGEFSSGNISSEGICEVLFRHGTNEELNILLQNVQTVENYGICALAVGGIITREQVSEDNVLEIFELAFQQDDPIIRRNLLYGFYRGRLNNPEPGSDLYEELWNIWERFGIGRDIQPDQFMARTFGARAVSDMLYSYSGRELNKHPQLAIELALGLEETIHENHQFEKLLRHSNPHVVIAVLESLKRFSSIDEDLVAKIKSVASHTRNHEVFIAALELLQEHDMPVVNYTQKLQFTESENPYLVGRILRIYKNLEPDEQFLTRLEEKMDDEGIEALQAGRALSEFSVQRNDEEQYNDRIRNLVRTQIKKGNRSAIDGLRPLLTNEVIILDDDYEWLADAFSNFRERGEDENAVVISNVLQERFPEQAGDVYEPEKNFRVPDWQRLYDLGTRPNWILETERGKIVIELDPLSAPFTVSSIDSLTRAGVYDDVPFHRVVKNFVVQGGDFERTDGFGGPDYTLPTEPSFKSFERGAAGIASSGTDTEGSQYFIMHQWAPHLDGNYTRFGHVVHGMDVVDRLQVGDMVLRAEIR